MSVCVEELKERFGENISFLSTWTTAFPPSFKPVYTTIHRVPVISEYEWMRERQFLKDFPDSKQWTTKLVVDYFKIEAVLGKYDKLYKSKQLNFKKYAWLKKNDNVIEYEPNRYSKFDFKDHLEIFNCLLREKKYKIVNKEESEIEHNNGKIELVRMYDIAKATTNKNYRKESAEKYIEELNKSIGVTWLEKALEYFLNSSINNNMQASTSTGGFTFNPNPIPGPSTNYYNQASTSTGGFTFNPNPIPGPILNFNTQPNTSLNVYFENSTYKGFGGVFTPNVNSNNNENLSNNNNNSPYIRNFDPDNRVNTVEIEKKEEEDENSEEMEVEDNNCINKLCTDMTITHIN